LRRGASARPGMRQRPHPVSAGTKRTATGEPPQPVDPRGPTAPTFSGCAMGPPFGAHPAATGDSSRLEAASGSKQDRRGDTGHRGGLRSCVWAPVLPGPKARQIGRGSKRDAPQPNSGPPRLERPPKGPAGRAERREWAIQEGFHKPTVYAPPCPDGIHPRFSPPPRLPFDHAHGRVPIAGPTRRPAPPPLPAGQPPDRKQTAARAPEAL
jgi:hypothetical protein